MSEKEYSSDIEELLEINDEEDGEVDLSGNKKIDSDAKDSDIDGLYRQYKKGRLIIQPNFQRKYVWDSKKASSLIESILIKVPIPTIYLAATKEGKINVIDGQQRLTSIFSFLDGSFPDGKKFVLSKLQVLNELSGKSFAELDDINQNKILDYTIRTVTFAADSDPDLQYEIFSRLNTGSVALNSQELRNCVYRGPFNDFIKELAADTNFLSLLGLSSPHKRMTDVELVLRFISFYKYSYINYKSPIKKFLNGTMRNLTSINDNEKKEIKEAFKKAVSNLTSLLGQNSFRRFKSGNNNDYVWEKTRINAALYDVLMDTMARIDPTVLMRHLDAIKEAYIDLMVSNQDFIDSIMINTSDTPVVNKRFTIFRATINSIIKDDRADTRCFSYALKKSLFDRDPTCAICNQHISSIDDAAVDHIEQYWMGGKTIPENARLTHRYCNLCRARKENKNQ